MRLHHGSYGRWDSIKPGQKLPDGVKEYPTIHNKVGFLSDEFEDQLFTICFRKHFKKISFET